MNRHPAVPILSAQRVSKSFLTGPVTGASGKESSNRLEILRALDLEIMPGEDLCIIGSSGAGKSTLLHILGTLDRPTLGKVFFRGQDLTKHSDDQLARFRNQTMGFVFQFHHLLGEFSALENVMMPCRIGGMGSRQARKEAEELLEFLGLSERLHHFPSEMSGGEQQRVAIARALVRKPEVLLADEPTGNLDTHNAERIQGLFFELKRRFQLTLIVVTHDEAFAGRFSRIKKLRDGVWV